MKRIVKSADVRRMEIIKTAENLFNENGYDNTSVEEIIKAAGIAKGTFYYYFKAKKDILQAIVDQITHDFQKYYESILERTDIDAIKKLRYMLRGSVKNKKVNPVVMNILHAPENRELQEKLNIESVKRVLPLLHKVFEQGYQEGIFKKLPSREVIQIIFAGSQFILDSGLFLLPSKNRMAFLQSIQELLEAVSGAKSNALHFIAK